MIYKVFYFNGYQLKLSNFILIETNSGTYPYFFKTGHLQNSALMSIILDVFIFRISSINLVRFGTLAKPKFQIIMKTDFSILFHLLNSKISS